MISVCLFHTKQQRVRVCACLCICACTTRVSCPCVEFRQVFRRSTFTMQKIAATVIDGEKGNFAAGMVPNRKGPCQRQQGGGQKKKQEKERDKGAEAQRDGEEIENKFCQGGCLQSVAAVWIQQYVRMCQKAEWKCVPTCYVTCLQG